MGELAVPVVHPLLKEKLRSWDPLKVGVLSFPNTFLAYLLFLKPMFSDFRTPLIVWKSSVSGGPFSNLETFTLVGQIQTWTLTIGYFNTHNMKLWFSIYIEWLLLTVPSLLVQTSVGSLDPSDAFVCVMLAAPYCETHGGMCRNMGSSPPPMDHWLLVGAASFATSSERGETHLTHNSF